MEVSDKDPKVDDRDKFPYLLEFLLKHKRAMEYGSNDLRSTKQVHYGSEKVHNAIGEEVNDGLQRADEQQKQPTETSKERKPGCWIHATTRHDILECCSFTEKDPKERMELV